MYNIIIKPLLYLVCKFQLPPPPPPPLPQSPRRPASPALAQQARALQQKVLRLEQERLTNTSHASTTTAAEHHKQLQAQVSVRGGGGGGGGMLCTTQLVPGLAILSLYIIIMHCVFFCIEGSLIQGYALYILFIACC